jgi:hypothetical protein
MASVEVTPEILRWAIERSGKEREVLARKFPKLDGWLRQDIEPTVRQVEAFAAATHTAFGYFFLPTPPVERLPIPDFRTRRAEGLRRPSGDLLDTIYLCQARQSWFEDFAIEEGLEPVQLVGALTKSMPMPEAARLIREAIGFDLEQRRKDHTWEEALRRLIQSVEDALSEAPWAVGRPSRRLCAC